MHEVTSGGAASYSRHNGMTRNRDGDVHNISVA